MIGSDSATQATVLRSCPAGSDPRFNGILFPSTGSELAGRADKTLPRVLTTGASNPVVDESDPVGSDDPVDDKRPPTVPRTGSSNPVVVGSPIVGIPRGRVVGDEVVETEASIPVGRLTGRVVVPEVTEPRVLRV